MTYSLDIPENFSELKKQLYKKCQAVLRDYVDGGELSAISSKGINSEQQREMVESSDQAFEFKRDLVLGTKTMQQMPISELQEALTGLIVQKMGNPPEFDPECFSVSVLEIDQKKPPPVRGLS